jgi:hypothetical protein
VSDAGSPREQAEFRSAWPHGVAAGLIGALVISLVFLVIDIADGRPLYTPNALGAALFRGESLAPEARIEIALVLGYTAVHGAVFIAVGLMAALSLLEGARRQANPLVGAAIAAAVLFAGFEILFEIFGQLFTPAEGRLGGSRAAFANALAALAMGGYFALIRARSAR